MQKLIEELRKMPHLEVEEFRPAGKYSGLTQIMHVLRIKFKRRGSVTPETIKELAARRGESREYSIGDRRAPRIEYSITLFHSRPEDRPPFVQIDLLRNTKLPTIELLTRGITPALRTKLVKLFSELGEPTQN